MVGEMTLNVLGLRSGEVTESDLIAVEHLATRLHSIKAAPTRDWRGRFMSNERTEDILMAAEVLEALAERCRTPHGGSRCTEKPK